MKLATRMAVMSLSIMTITGLAAFSASAATTLYDLSGGDALDTVLDPFEVELSDTPTGLLTISTTASVADGILLIGSFQNNTGSAVTLTNAKIQIDQSFYDSTGTINVSDPIVWNLGSITLTKDEVFNLSTELDPKTLPATMFNYDPNGIVGLRYTISLSGLPTNVDTLGVAAGIFGSEAGDQLRFSAVPETSTSLLGAIGALALLRRRR